MTDAEVAPTPVEEKIVQDCPGRSSQLEKIVAKIDSLTKAITAKIQATKPTHPSAGDMVIAAVKALGERHGSSLQAIKKYIAANYKVDVEKQAVYIKKFLKSAVEKGTLVQTKGKGASGSFKLPVTKIASKPKPKAASGEKKPAAAKKPAAKKIPGEPKSPVKKATGPKKATAKKTASPKKPAAKAPAKPKAAASPKAKKAAKAPTAKPRAPKPKKIAAPKTPESPVKKAADGK